MCKKTARLYHENLLSQKLRFHLQQLSIISIILNDDDNDILDKYEAHLLHAPSDSTVDIDYIIIILIATFPYRSSNERNMTRTTRSRQSRIHSALQSSGYCEICHITYNEITDHLQSRRHLKLVGDDASFASPNSFIHPDSFVISRLNGGAFTPFKMLRTRTVSLCGRMKDSSPSSPGRHETAGHRLRSRKTINYRTPSLSLMDDDSLTEEKPDNDVITRGEYRELRSSTRLLTKLTDQISNATVAETIVDCEVWNSGRPKRRCINNKQKRFSVDERLAAIDNKKDVVTNKSRAAMHNQVSPTTTAKRLPVSSLLVNNHKDSSDDNDLIIKYPKLRNAELIRLNNEAENFLFPKKDDSITTATTDDDDDDDDDDDEEDDDNVDDDKDYEDTSSKKDKVVDVSHHNTRTTTKTINNSKTNCASLLSSDTDESQSVKKFKIEDDSSMHSTSSESNNKTRKRRRTQAEAFITDNQKYYKFETPGSRLRYQGTYLQPSVPSTKSPKYNGDCTTSTVIKSEKHHHSPSSTKHNNNIVQEQTKTSDAGRRVHLNIDEYQFSFEQIPKNDDWFQTFQRQDHGNEHYHCVDDDYYFNTFILPYQIGYNNIPPLNPDECITQYNEITKCLLEATSISSSTSSSTSTPDPSSTCNSLSSVDCGVSNSLQQFTVQDEDSKISATDLLLNSLCSNSNNSNSSSTTQVVADEDAKEISPVIVVRKKRGPKPKKHLLTGNNSTVTATTSSSGGRNPRKSPRQHASTLAILSSLLQQRKKRKSIQLKKQQQQQKLSPIQEEIKQNNKKSSIKQQQNSNIINKSSNTIADAIAIAKAIDEELMRSSTLYDDNLYMEFASKNVDDLQIDFHCKTDIGSILLAYDQSRSSGASMNNNDCKSPTKRIFKGGTPGRKPGRKKKKNRTGWPNRNKRIFVRKIQSTTVVNNNSTIVSGSNNNKDEDDSTIDSLSVNAEEDLTDTTDENVYDDDDLTRRNSTDNSSIIINNKQDKVVKLINNSSVVGSEVVVVATDNNSSNNNNKNDQSNLGDDDAVNVNNNVNNIIVVEPEHNNIIVNSNNNCDLLNNSDRVDIIDNDNCLNNKSVDNDDDDLLQQQQTTTDNNKVLTTKVNNNSSDETTFNNIDLQFQPYVRVQKLNSDHINNKERKLNGSSSPSSKQQHVDSPKRTIRRRRRMPASPKSPRMLRRPRGRWYRER